MIDDLARLRTDRSAVARLEIGAALHVVRPLVADLLATFCFYAVYAASSSVGLATILAAALGVGQVVWTLVKRREVPALQWASLLLVLIVGAISLATNDARYVLYKASLIYLVIGASMLRRGWLGRYVPPIATTYFPDRLIVRFGYGWALLIIGTGLLSLVLIWTMAPRISALAMGLWAPASKIVLLAIQYIIGRRIVRRNIKTALMDASAEESATEPPA